MKKLISLFNVIVLVLGSHKCKAQTYEEPPKIAMASDRNKPLIDKIIAITDYESYFKNYCINSINKTAKKQKWTTERRESVFTKMDFTEFKVKKLYNWLSGYSTKELNEFIEFYKKDKNRKTKNIIINDCNISQALEWYAESLVKN